jgi:RND superfamily putative drug exporter
MHPTNLAARAGRWSAQHRKTAIFGWLAFVVIAFVLGNASGTITLTQDQLGVGDSARAQAIVKDAFPQRDGEMVLVQSRTQTASDPAFRAAVKDVRRRLAARPEVAKIDAPKISPDHHSALVQFEIKGDVDQASKVVGGSLAATAAAQQAHPDLRIEQFGGATADKALSKLFDDSLHQAETLSLPVTLVILLVAFGALVAAGLPLLLGLSAVMATMGLVAGLSHVTPSTDNMMSLLLLIGLAVGVDYSLFYIRREREERRAGRDAEAALQAAAATSGRAVLVSGFTVMAAMSGMYLTGMKDFAAMGTGTILVVAVAMLGSLTVLPALLSKLGDRVDKGRIPFIGKRMAARGESRVWAAVLDRVLRRPVVSVVVAGGLLVALAVPALGMHTADSGVPGLPQNLPVIKTYNRINHAFPGQRNAAEVVVKASDVNTPAVKSAIARLQAQGRASGNVVDDLDVRVSHDGTVADVTVPIRGTGTDPASYAALAYLRDEAVPATVGRLPGAEAYVGGGTAASRDYNDVMTSHAPYVFALVMGLAFLLLMVTFRSIVIPLKAIVLNLLSVGAAYGLLVLVFQKGWGESLLGFHSTGSIGPWLPLFLFVILFGLSMDYHVFIISRIREAVGRGMKTEDAVAEGIKSTAGVVTSAAIVMVAVFGIFATLPILDLKQLGIGLGAAILIDATIVRAVLLPATMKLLGDWNWYLPKRLHRLPQIAHEPALAPAAA